MRTATLYIVSTATIAAYVALGGLGRYVVDGLALRDFPQMLTGAMLVALLVIVLDLFFALLARLTVSDGLTGRVRTGRRTTTGRPNETTTPAEAGI